MGEWGEVHKLRHINATIHVLSISGKGTAKFGDEQFMPL